MKTIEQARREAQEYADSKTSTPVDIILAMLEPGQRDNVQRMIQQMINRALFRACMKGIDIARGEDAR